MPVRNDHFSPKIDSHALRLGVDGGGTKTHAVLLNLDGQIVAEAFGGPSNPLRVGVDSAVENIFESVTDACDSANRNATDIDSGVFGLAGVRRQDLRDRVKERLQREFRLRRIRVVTDAEIAWYGTTLGKAGIVLISGTGSICFGKDSRGRIAISGGWGPIAGDEGGGISIAKKAIRAVAKASDGRGAQTGLSEVAADYFRASTPEDLIVAIYSPLMDNKRLAGFAKYTIGVAKSGDRIALEIVREAGKELGIAANAVIDQLNLTDMRIPIGMAGSIFRAGELLTKPLMEVVRPFAGKAHLVKPKLVPAVAAATLALEEFES